MKWAGRFVLVSFLLATSATSQIVRTWTPYPGGNNYWFADTNWTPEGVPGFEDTIVIGTNANVWIERTVDIGGTLRWGGGSFSATYPGLAGWTIAPGGTVEILGPLQYSGQLTNSGTLVVTNDAYIHQGIYSRLYNLTNGVIRLAGNNELRAYELNAWIENRGLLLHEGTGTTGTVRGTFYHYGTVEARGGTLLGRDHQWTGYDGGRYIGAGGEVRIQSTTLLQEGAFVSSNLWISGYFGGTNRLLGEMTLANGAAFSGGSGVRLTEIAPASRVVIAGDVSFNTTRITNSGTLELNGDLNLVVQYASTVVNQPDGVIRAVGENRISQWSSANQIINHGLFLKDGGSGPTRIELPFENYGTMDARDGVMEVGGVFTAHGGSRFTGAGTNRIVGVNYGPLTVAGPVVSSNLWLMNGGTLQGTGSISGVLHWSGGTLGQTAPNGPLTLATNCVLEVVGTADRGLSGIVTNAGHIRVADGAKFAFGRTGSRLVHLPGALFEFVGDGTLDAYEYGPVLENRGVIRKSGGAGAALLNYPVTLENHGLVDIQSGQLDVLGPFHALTGSRLEGAAEVRNGPYLVVGDTFAEDLRFVSGSAKGTGAFSGTLHWSTGGYLGPFTVATNGVLEMISGAVHNVTPGLTNSGLIVLRDNAQLQLTGDGNARLMNLPGGVIDLRSDNYIYPYSGGPVIVNHGVVRRSAGTGTARINMTRFENHGRVEVLSGVLQFNWGLQTEDGSRFEGPVEFQGTELILNGDTFADDLRLLGGNSIHGPGRFSGVARWSGGNVGGQGPFHLHTNGVLEFTGSGRSSANHWITNAGVIRLQDSAKLLINNDSGLMNLPGGQVQLNGAITQIESGTQSRFVNQGVVRSGSGGTVSLAAALVLENAGVVEAARGRLTLPGNNYVDAGGLLRVRMFGADSNSVIGFWQPLFLPMARLAGELEPGYLPDSGAHFSVFEKLAVTSGSPSVTNLPPEFVWRIESQLATGDVPVGTSFTVVGPVVVGTAPEISVQPMTTAAFVGMDVVLQVAATGSEPLAYQWRFGTELIPAATNSSLLLTNVQSGQAGAYVVTVTNALGSVTSQSAALSVFPFQLESGMTPGGFRLMIPTLDGATFRVESSPTMRSGTWETVGTVLSGNGAVVEVMDGSATSQPWRFYRVLKLP